MKNLTRWWTQRLDKYYLKKRWYLVADIILVTVVLTLVIIFFALWLYRPQIIGISPISHIEKNQPPLGTSLSIEASVDSVNIYSDKEFKLKIKAINSGKLDINDLELAPFLSSNKFSFSRINSSDANSQIQIIGRKLKLDKLPAGQSAEINLAVVIKGLPAAPRTINWKLEGTYREQEALQKISQVLPDLKLSSSLTVQAAAYYNSPMGDQLGSGPIPPQVSNPTNYWIFLTPQNIGNKLGSFMVSAKIAPGVSFYDRKSLSAGNFSYNEKQRRLTWSVENLDPDNDSYQAGFELQLIPDAKQLGLAPLLLTDIVFSAKDLFTGDKIYGLSAPVNTDLPFDAINKGQGGVIK